MTEEHTLGHVSRLCRNDHWPAHGLGPPLHRLPRGLVPRTGGQDAVTIRVENFLEELIVVFGAFLPYRQHWSASDSCGGDSTDVAALTSLVPRIVACLVCLMERVDRLRRVNHSDPCFVC